MGAPQSRLYETVLGLQKLGWQVMVVTAMPNYPTGNIFKDYTGKFSMQEHIDGIDVHRYTLYSSHAKKALPRIVSMLSFSATAMCSLSRVRKFKPDYIITESPPLTVGLTGLALARFSGAKHILNVSDIWPLSALRLGAISDGWLYKRLESLERYLYRRSHACMGQSYEIKERLEEAGSKQTLLFRNGVDFKRFEQLRANNIKPQENNKLRIVYAGLLGLAQGVFELCQKVDFASLGAELHIYGAGADLESIKQFIAQHPQRGIYLHGTVHRNDIPETLMKYDITLIPLVTPIYGAVPSKIYEAMAAGLPIIFSGGGEGERIIEEHKTGWSCNPSDYKQIAEQIKEVAKMSSEELETVRMNCIEAARNIFNREIQIQNLNQFLLKNQ